MFYTKKKKVRCYLPLTAFPLFLHFLDQNVGIPKCCATSSPDLIVYPVDTAKENLGLAWARTYTTLKSSGVVLQDTVFMERQNLCESSDLFHAVTERQAKVTVGLRMRTTCAVWNAASEHKTETTCDALLQSVRIFEKSSCPQLYYHVECQTPQRADVTRISCKPPPTLLNWTIQSTVSFKFNATAKVKTPREFSIATHFDEKTQQLKHLWDFLDYHIFLGFHVYLFNILRDEMAANVVGPCKLPRVQLDRAFESVVVERYGNQVTVLPLPHLSAVAAKNTNTEGMLTRTSSRDGWPFYLAWINHILKEETKWYSILDVDEFLVIEDEVRFRRLLHSHAGSTQVLHLSWLIFNDPANVPRPASVVEHFPTPSCNKLRRNVKMALQPSVLNFCCFNNHRIYKDNHPTFSRNLSDGTEKNETAELTPIEPSIAYVAHYVSMVRHRRDYCATMSPWLPIASIEGLDPRKWRRPQIYCLHAPTKDPAYGSRTSS
ncbi:hypothetical protein RI054_16g76910 [Pseudoscourfieldia marina]